MAGERILLAEDNLANIQLFEAILGRSGYELDIAPDGEKAVFLGTRNRYDLILMDLGLPKMDGLEATKRIRDTKQPAPIVALTAEDDTRIERACKAVGMSGMIRKPVSPANLIQEVARYMSRKMRSAS